MRVFTLCLVFLACVWSPAGRASDPYKTDAPVALVLPRLDGGEIAIEGLRGQWVVLNYWATWCAPCREEIPELMTLHGQREDITVLGLAYEEVEEGVFDDFLREFQPNYPILLVDVFSPPEPFGAPKVLPTTVLLDPRGHAVKGFVGPVTRAQLEAFIDRVPSP
ncbi:MAG: TlpA family protein disulfide reductase [Lysobacterales bacterium]